MLNLNHILLSTYVNLKISFIPMKVLFVNLFTCYLFTYNANGTCLKFLETIYIDSFWTSSLFLDDYQFAAHKCMNFFLRKSF